MPIATETRTTTVLLQGLHDALNHEAWETFDRRYRPIIVGFAKRLGLGDADAADVAQTTLVEFLTKYRVGAYERSRGRLRSWLVGLARHCVANVYRGRERRRETGGDAVVAALSDDETLTNAWNGAHRAHVLRLAMERLRETTRTSERSLAVFDLLIVRGVPPEQVASHLGLTVHDVYQAKSRIAERLRAIVGELEAAYEEDA